MRRMMIRRALMLVAVVVLVSLGAALLLELTPGDPALVALGDAATPEAVADLREEMGLDDAFPLRWANWVGAALAGDFGNSLQPPGARVLDRIVSALPITLQIMAMALGIAVVTALSLALVAARRAGSRLDRAIAGVSFASVSLPSFVLALVFALLFAVWIPIFPRIGWVPFAEAPLLSLRSTLLPAIVLAIPEIAAFTQVLRNDLIATMRKDYVLAARARGVPQWRVLLVHALKPSSFSFITMFGLVTGRLLGGAIIVETIFDLPGLGTLMFSAAQSSDFPLIQALVLLIAVVYVFVNTIVDALYGVLDPRVRRRHAGT